MLPIDTVSRPERQKGISITVDVSRKQCSGQFYICKTVFTFNVTVYKSSNCVYVCVFARARVRARARARACVCVCVCVCVCMLVMMVVVRQSEQKVIAKSIHRVCLECLR